jgi:predicted transcriptional regulator
MASEVFKMSSRITFTSSIDKTLRDSLKQLSEETRITQSKLLDEAIEDLLKKYEKKRD